MRNFSFVEPTFQAREYQLEISQTIYDANVFDIKNWKNGFRTNPDMLPNSVTKFLSLLAELDVDYCIVGGIAYLAYIQDRNTKDLDILISVEELNKITPFVEIDSQDANFTNTEFEGLKIDFLKTSNALFKYVKKNQTVKYEFAEGAFPIAGLSYKKFITFNVIIRLSKSSAKFSSWAFLFRHPVFCKIVVAKVLIPAIVFCKLFFLNAFCLLSNSHLECDYWFPLANVV
ncbi:MAG: hypothetical protein H0X15_03165 [Acidobacteria bacterium]|nr:hypothetical protein [Acidobacteriota bacterium]